MINRMPFPMRDAPLIQLRFLCNGDPARYTVELTGTLGAGGRELWLVHKSSGPRGGAAATYRVWLPPYSPRVMPTDLRAQASCDCPEAQSGATRLGGVCKHMLMAYCWQGCYAGSAARWFYTDAYLFTMRSFQQP
jgi:hypothetical protein